MAHGHFFHLSSPAKRPLGTSAVRIATLVTALLIATTVDTALAAPVGQYLGSPIVLTDTQSARIDINDDAIDDLLFEYAGASEFGTDGWDTPVSGLSNAQIVISTIGVLSDPANRFTAGSVIGPGGLGGPLADVVSLAYSLLFEGDLYSEGDFEDARGFIGVLFPIGAQNHWGWADVKINHIDYPAAAGAVEIYGWGYETSDNTGIEAGVIPEPATLTLLALATTAACLRRRNR